MVKICLSCHYVNAGGYRCSECGGRLVHTSDPEARALPEAVWRSQRVDYGARRGMIMRFLAIFSGALTGLYGLRESLALPAPWSRVAAVGALALGLSVWWALRRAATRGVRIWVLAKGRVHNRRLLRAMLAGLRPSFRRARKADLREAPSGTSASAE